MYLEQWVRTSIFPYVLYLTTFHSKKALSLLNWTAGYSQYLKRLLDQQIVLRIISTWQIMRGWNVENNQWPSRWNWQTINWFFYVLIRDTTLFSSDSLKGFILAKHSINITSYHYSLKGAKELACSEFKQSQSTAKISKRSKVWIPCKPECF